MGLGCTNYSVSCCDCGNTGSVSIWTDDWYRWQSEWKGFRRDEHPNRPETCNHALQSLQETQYRSHTGGGVLLPAC
jgi:hypothetical protein